MDQTEHWYVVHTQPSNEVRAETNLRQQDFKVYLPRYLRQRRHARRTEIVPRPLFPRYLFVCLDLERDRWRSINSTFGVSNLVMAQERPVPIADGVIDEIRSREDAEGYVQLGLRSGLKPGAKVRFVEGIFMDTQGVLEKVADARRVVVLLQLLGREVRATVSATDIGPR